MEQQTELDLCSRILNFSKKQTNKNQIPRLPLKNPPKSMPDDSWPIDVLLCDGTTRKQSRRQFCPPPKGILFIDKPIYIPIIDEIILFFS